MYYQLLYVDVSDRASSKKISTFCDRESFNRECEAVGEETVLAYVGDNPISNLVCGKTADELTDIMIFEHSGIESIVKTIETTLTDAEKEELLRLLHEKKN